MPSERRGTVTDDIAGYMRKIQGSSEWKGDKAGTIRAAIAKVTNIYKYDVCQRLTFLQMDFPVEDVVRNTRHFLAAVKKATGNTAEKDPNAAQGKNQQLKPGEKP